MLRAARANVVAANARWSMMAFAAVLMPESLIAPNATIASTVSAIRVSGMSVFVRSFKLSIFIGWAFSDAERASAPACGVADGSCLELERDSGSKTGTSARHHAFDARLEPRVDTSWEKHREF